jgi:hypothetical protein
VQDWLYARDADDFAGPKAHMSGGAAQENAFNMNPGVILVANSSLIYKRRCP